MFVGQNNVEAATFILKLMIFYQECQLVNVRNIYQQTPLQLAIMCHNERLVEYLMKSGALVKEANDWMNTALHTAVEENVSVGILEKLLEMRDYEKRGEFIDEMNQSECQKSVRSMFMSFVKNLVGQRFCHIPVL